MPAHDDGATHSEGRRTKTFNGGNRGKGYVRRCGVSHIIFSDARHATAGSTRGITYGFWITKARCRTRRKIKRSSATGSSARARWRVRTWPAQCPRLIAPTHDDAGLMILRRRLALRSRNHLDQNYKPSLHRFIFDGGVGAQQSETENAVGDEQAVDI